MAQYEVGRAHSHVGLSAVRNEPVHLVVFMTAQARWCLLRISCPISFTAGAQIVHCCHFRRPLLSQRMRDSDTTAFADTQD